MARSYVRNFYGAPIWSRGFVLGSYLLTLESASIQGKSSEAFEHTRSLLGIDEYGLMHEDDSRSPSGGKKNDARCVRGYTRPADPLPRRRDKTPLGEERARRDTIRGDSWKLCEMDRRKLENYFFGLLCVSGEDIPTMVTNVIISLRIISRIKMLSLI